MYCRQIVGQTQVQFAQFLPTGRIGGKLLHNVVDTFDDTRNISLDFLNTHLYSTIDCEAVMACENEFLYFGGATRDNTLRFMRDTLATSFFKISLYKESALV